MIVDTAWNNALISLLQIVEDEMIKLSLTGPLYSSRWTSSFAEANRFV